MCPITHRPPAPVLHKDRDNDLILVNFDLYLRSLLPGQPRCSGLCSQRLLIINPGDVLCSVFSVRSQLPSTRTLKPQPEMWRLSVCFSQDSKVSRSAGYPDGN